MLVVVLVPNGARGTWLVPGGLESLPTSRPNGVEALAQGDSRVERTASGSAYWRNWRPFKLGILLKIGFRKFECISSP